MQYEVIEFVHIRVKSDKKGDVEMNLSSYLEWSILINRGRVHYDHPYAGQERDGSLKVGIM